MVTTVEVVQAVVLEEGAEDDELEVVAAPEEVAAPEDMAAPEEVLEEGEEDDELEVNWLPAVLVLLGVCVEVALPGVVVGKEVEGV